MKLKSISMIAGCLIAPAIAAAQTGGLTRVQLLALQQQLKEECGLAHATGRMDGPTRHAIAVCNKKYGTHGNGAALLRAMNIGFDSGDMAPTGMGSVMGASSGMASGGGMGGDATVTTSPPKTRRARRADRTTIAAQTDSIMRADRDAHGYNQGKTKKSDTTYSAVADSLARATRGLPSGPTKTKTKH